MCFVFRYFTDVIGTVTWGKQRSSKGIEKVTEEGHRVKAGEVSSSERRKKVAQTHCLS